jgi:hypothetical protein
MRFTAFSYCIDVLRLADAQLRAKRSGRARNTASRRQLSEF